MAALAYQAGSVAGAVITLAAAGAGGDTIAIKERGVLIVRNADSTATTVTMVAPGNADSNNARPNVVRSVAAGAFVVFGPFTKDRDNWTVSLTYSKVVDLTIGAISA